MVPKIRLITLICFFMVVVAGIPSLQAQDAAQHYLILNIKVKPGANKRLEEFVGKYKDAVNKISAPDRWLASQAFAGGGNSYNFVVPFSNWTTFANPRDILDEAYNDREERKVLGLLEDSAVSMTRTAYTVNPDLSRSGPASDQQELGVILIYTKLNPGMEAQFAEFMTKLREATDATAPNAYWTTLDSNFGGSGPLIVVPVRSWAQLDNPEKQAPQRFTEHFGEKESQRLMALLPRIFASAEVILHVARPDLANPPE